MYAPDVAFCDAGGVEDLNAEPVKAGLAIACRAYSMLFVALEENAREAGVGAWAGDFVEPWDLAELGSVTSDLDIYRAGKLRRRWIALNNRWRGRRRGRIRRRSRTNSLPSTATPREWQPPRHR